MPKGSNLGCRSDQSSFARYWIMKKVLGIFALGQKSWIRKRQALKNRPKYNFGSKKGVDPPCPLNPYQFRKITQNGRTDKKWQLYSCTPATKNDARCTLPPVSLPFFLLTLYMKWSGIYQYNYNVGWFFTKLNIK